MKKKSTIILILLLFLSIGFAILSSNLSLTSNIAIAEAKFDVHFEEVEVEKTNLKEYSNPVLNANKDAITLETNLDKPGDYITLSFLVVNAGTIDAQLNEIIKTEFNTEEAKYLSQSYKYLNGSIPKSGDLLRVGNIRRIKLTYQYNYDVENFISIGEKTMSFSMKYIQPQNYNENVWTYDYQNTYQTFTTPKTGNYKIELWGAQGGSIDNGIYNGGYGGYTSGTISLQKEDKIYIYVGEVGMRYLYNMNNALYNGGGICKFNIDAGGGGSGGGSTDIRLIKGEWNDFDSLKSRIMVAGAGGGKGYAWTLPGASGGLCGLDGTQSDVFSTQPYGMGATQFRTGSWTLTHSSLIPGGFGYGGTSIGGWDGGGAGGAGYFGGSGGCVNSGGGGSSFISGHAGCVAISEDSTEDNITFVNDSNGIACNDSSSSGYNDAGYNTDVACSKHYSEKVFTNTVMIDGQGYKWNPEKASTAEGMPTFDGTGTMTGNSGNGYAKITYLG